MSGENFVLTLNGHQAQVSSIFRPLKACETICDQAVLRLEHESFIHDSDRVAFIFLLYEDSRMAYDKITSLLKGERVDIFDHLRGITDNWKIKVLESFSITKLYRGIRYVGLDKWDVLFNSKEESIKFSNRGFLYNLCEQLTVDETNQLIEEMDKAGFPCPEEICSPIVYLEYYLLHWIVSGRTMDQIFESIHKFLVKMKKEHIMQDSCRSLETTDLILCPRVQPRIKYIQSEAYEIRDSENVGLCIVINEVDYFHHKPRKGSEKDVSMIESTMKELKFDVKTIQNAGGCRLASVLKKHINESFLPHHSVLFMIIMAHGVQGQIIGIDEGRVDIQDIADLTTSFDCLNRKPKVLVVQACQGDLHLDRLETDGSAFGSLNLVSQKSATDIIVAMSTIQGFQTYRDTAKGCFFVQTLCEMLNSYRHEEICKILQRVNRHFAKPFLKGGIGLQPEFRSRLTKDLYLCPPQTELAEKP